jgi:DNA-binding HxlR family transcriptional regulator
MKEFVLLCALAETSRFTSFRRAAFTLLSEVVLGIIYKMLTQPLHLMECEGLIARTVHAVVPPKVGFIILSELILSLGAAICGVWMGWRGTFVPTLPA